MYLPPFACGGDSLSVSFSSSFIIMLSLLAVLSGYSLPAKTWFWIFVGIDIFFTVNKITFLKIQGARILIDEWKYATIN